ncbi:helix-turn-helix domain-containing protein [Streptomyces roseolus]
MSEHAGEADWSVRLAQSISMEVRRQRHAKGLSAQQLSDRCAALGMPIQRSVLANLESGRRTTVTFAEVLVLAAALEVAPATLAFPVGRKMTVEVLPGVERQPLDAIRWMAGLASTDGVEFQDRDSSVVQRFIEHEELVKRTLRALNLRDSSLSGYADAAPGREASERLEELEARAAQIVDQIQELEKDPEVNAPLIEQLASERQRLGSASAEVAQEAYRYRLARTRAERNEIGAMGVEARLRAYRQGLRVAGLFPPKLPERLLYLDEGAEDPVETLDVDSPEFSDVTYNVDPAEVAEGSGEAPSFLSPALLESLAESIAGMVMSKLQEKGITGDAG